MIGVELVCSAEFGAVFVLYMNGNDYLWRDWKHDVVAGTDELVKSW